MTTEKLKSKFTRYKENLSIVEVDEVIYIKSYKTLVARIDYENYQLLQLGYWSQTTQKHINYAAYQLGLKLIK